jgi:voltage-gated potassium channel
MSRTSLARSLITCANRTAQALAVFVPLVLGLGFVVALLEGWPLWSSDWWHFAMVTASTVGYGDLSPVTLGGRLVGDFLLIPVGVMGIGVIVGRIAATVIETRDAWKHEEQEEVKDGIVDAKTNARAARVTAQQALELLQRLAADEDVIRGVEERNARLRTRAARLGRETAELQRQADAAESEWRTAQARRDTARHEAAAVIRPAPTRTTPTRTRTTSSRGGSGGYVDTGATYIDTTPSYGGYGSSDSSSSSSSSDSGGGGGCD